MLNCNRKSFSFCYVRLLGFTACFVVVAHSLSFHVLLLLFVVVRARVGVIHREGRCQKKTKTKKNKETRLVMRAGPERKIKERHACWDLCVVSHAKGPTAAGVLILGLVSFRTHPLSESACPSPPVIPACRACAWLDSRKMG